MQKVAFFDIDGTVFRSSLLIELMEGLIEAEIFDPAVRATYIDSYTSWRNREGSYEEYIKAVITAYVTNIKGVHYGDVADVGKAAMDQHKKQVYRYTRDLVAMLKKQQYYVVAISQSPKTILDEFCKNHGFDKVYGRIYELGPTDKFTGEMEDVHLIENKANIVKRVFDTGEFDKIASIAVGDTEGDISMLDMVDQPICFNPNRALFDHATRMGWKVVVERKDVIYEL